MEAARHDCPNGMWAGDHWAVAPRSIWGRQTPGGVLPAPAPVQLGKGLGISRAPCWKHMKILASPRSPPRVDYPRVWALRISRCGDWTLGRRLRAKMLDARLRTPNGSRLRAGH